MVAILSPFSSAAQFAVADALGVSAEQFVVGSPPNPAMGDLAVGCFPAARDLKTAPAVLAAKVAAAFEPTPLLSGARAAGPFVNFTVSSTALFSHLADQTLGEGDLISKKPGEGQSICIDFSSPNISKQLAYHHIRSTVIGHALANLYRALGFRVIGINHLGDWGTTHGMLLAAYHKWPPTEDLTIETLGGLYVRFRAEMNEDSSLADEGRAWFAKLEAGDEDARRLWQLFKDVSWAEFESAYKMLGITFDEVKGESEYVEDMPGVLEMLAEKGLSSVSEGALVVMLEEDGMPPLLLRKQDGATLYGTRDLAAAIYRWNEYAFTRSLYVVDRGQGLHFKQLFRTLEKAGLTWSAKCHHVPFGLVRVGGKKTGTRSGNVVLLKEVFAEAVDRASAKISENNTDWSTEQVDLTAQIVGIGAIVFANLMSQRDKDVDFDWDDVLSTSGDSGAYVQYAHARCCRTLEKGGFHVSSGEANFAADFNLLMEPQEKTLGLALLQFGEVVARSAHTNDPHLLSRYLLDLVSSFSSWYTQGNQDKSLRILCEDVEIQKSRLTLLAMVRAVLRTGLEILGVGAPTSM